MIVHCASSPLTYHREIYSYLQSSRKPLVRASSSASFSLVTRTGSFFTVTHNMPNSKIPPLFSNLLPSSNLPQPPQSTSTGPGVVYTKRRQDLRYVNKTPYPHHTPAASPPFYSVPALFPTVDGEAAFLSSKCVPSMGKTNLHNRCRALLPQQWTKTFLQHSQRCNLLSLSATTQREAPFT